MIASVQYHQPHAAANQEHAHASHNLHSLQCSQQPNIGPHPTHYMPHFCNPFCNLYVFSKQITCFSPTEL